MCVLFEEDAMTQRQTTLVRPAVLTVGISLGATQSVQARLLLAGQINGVNFCVADQNVPSCTFGTQLVDFDPNPGRIEINGEVVVGNVQLAGSLSTATFTSSLNLLTTSSLSFRNLSQLPATVTLAVSATDFV